MSDTPQPLPNPPQSPPGGPPTTAQPGSGQAANQSGTGATPAEAAAGAAPSTIVYEDFAKVQFRVATVLEAKPAPKGDRLLVLQIDLGNEKRQILAGIRQHVTPEQMVGRQVIVVANLAPRQMMGLTSQGMLLAATDGATGKVVVLGPVEPVAAGSEVK